MFDERDAAAAGADAFHVHRREAGQIALERTAEPRFMRERDMPVTHKRRVKSRPAGIEYNRIMRFVFSSCNAQAGDWRH